MGQIRESHHEKRRQFLSILAALGITGPGLLADEPRPRTRAAGAVALPSPFDQQTATFTELYLEPGKGSTPHKHNGFVLGYVIEGEFRFQTSDGPERILRAGDIFYEAPGVTHLKSESASTTKPARVIAIVIGKSEKKN